MAQQSLNVAYSDGSSQVLWEDGERVFSRGWRLDDNGNRLARIPHGVHRHRAVLRRRKRRANGHRREELGDLLSGEHGFDAVHGGRCAGIDGADLSVSDVAAFEREMLHPDQRDVVHVGSATLNESGVFAALHALAYELRQYRSGRHGLTSSRWLRVESR